MLYMNFGCYPDSPKINFFMSHAGFNTLYDLPLTSENKIDFQLVQNKIQSTRNKNNYNAFLACYALQQKFGQSLPSITPGLEWVNLALVTQSKMLLRVKSRTMLSLDK